MNRHSLQVISLTMVSIAAMPIASVADVLSVPSGKYLTIQSAMEAANQNGDEIAVGPGIYHENIDFLGKSVNLHSTNGTSLTFIDGQGIGGTLVRFVTEEDENAILDGFTIRSATSSAISTSNASPTILNCRIVGNSSGQGGGLNVNGGSPTVTDCVFRENTATDRGGGINCIDSNPSFLRVEVRLNKCTGTLGGGMCLEGGTTGLDDCTIEDNFLESSTGANVSGGGIYATGELSITGSSISYNRAHFTWNITASSDTRTAKGGGICATGPLTISNTVMASNGVRTWNTHNPQNGTNHTSKTFSQGGGLYASGATCLLMDVVLSGNTVFAHGDGDANGSYARYAYVQPNAQGGGVYLAGVTPQLLGCTSQANTSSHQVVDYGSGELGGWGGGLYQAAGVTSTIMEGRFIGNAADSGGDGLFSRGTAVPFVISAQFTANGAEAIRSDSSTPVISGCLINGHTIGIKVIGGLPLAPTVSGTLFCENTTHISGGWYDKGDNAFTDDCGADCNGNGVPDGWDLQFGFSLDCNSNGIPDECDLADGTEADCNANGVPDSCDITNGDSTDCDNNSIPDECDIDCNANGVPDPCDVDDGTSEDCNLNGIPDECDLADGTLNDCNNNGIPDACGEDCNGSGYADECDIADGTSEDCDGNGVPDECDPDCNGNGVGDGCDILDGTSTDCDLSGVPDECEDIDDCNDNGLNDACDIANGTSDDVNGYGIPDECECPADINGDGFVNVNDILELLSVYGTSDEGGDINGDGIVGVDDILILIGTWGPCA
jgi:predicted outer membrane repeat protein